MSKWEEVLLGSIKAMLPVIGTFFVHSSTSKGAVLFNAGDELFSGVVTALSQQQAGQSAKAPSGDFPPPR